VPKWGPRVFELVENGENPEADSVWKNGKDFSKALNYAENKANKIADNALARFKDHYKFPLKSKKLSTRKRFTCSDASFEKQNSKYEIIETKDRNDPNKQLDQVAVFNSTNIVVTDERRVGFNQAKKNHKKWIPDVAIPFVYSLSFTITDLPVDMSCNDIASSLEQYLKTEAAK